MPAPSSPLPGSPSTEMDELRSRRASARRATELARMRAKQGCAESADEVARLDAQATALTGELIARYAADLSLVDSLLEPAYPAKVTANSARRDGR